MDAYYDEPDYIMAIKAHLVRYLQQTGFDPDYYVLTFHGIPKRYADTGDPYPEQCMETARLIAQAMDWKPEQWQLTYQSRFGPEEWIGPATADVLKGLAERGVKRPLVFSPGLVTDCVETLYELDVEGRMQFAEGGGDPDQYRVAPCLNDAEEWMGMLAKMVQRHAMGWVEADQAVMPR